MIYFDHAATSKVKPQEVIDAVVDAMTHFGNASRGAHDESLSADRVIYATRLKLARLFNVGNARQVAFTKNSTEALNIAIRGLLHPGDHVITSVSEHNSVLRPLNYLKREGAAVDYLGVDAAGCLRLDELPELCRPQTRAVVLTHASNVTGNITDLARVGRFCRDRNLLFIVDASQTAGAFPIDMQAMAIDALCFTGHKSMLGPQGTGGICIREGVEVDSLIVGGSGTHSYDPYQPQQMPTRLEGGTLNAHGIAGLGAGVDYINRNGMATLTDSALACMRRFHSAVRAMPQITCYGEFSGLRAPIVSINIGDMDSSEVSKLLLESAGIATRPGAHCAPLIHKAMGTADQGMVRFSFSHSNTPEEVDFAIDALHRIIDNRRL